MIRLQTPINNQRIVMNQKDCQNFLLGMLVIFGAISLFSVLAFLLAIIALCR